MGTGSIQERVFLFVFNLEHQVLLVSFTKTNIDTYFKHLTLVPRKMLLTCLFLWKSLFLHNDVISVLLSIQLYSGYAFFLISNKSSLQNGFELFIFLFNESLFYFVMWRYLHERDCFPVLYLHHTELGPKCITHRVISDRVHRLLVTLSYFRPDRFVQLLSLIPILILLLYYLVSGCLTSLC